MTIKAIAFCTYLTRVEHGWRPSDYAAANLVKAIKGSPLIGSYSDVRINGVEMRLTEANREDALIWFGQWCWDELAREYRRGRLALVPIPSKAAVHGFANSYPSLRMARQTAARSGGRAVVVDALRWRRRLPPAHQGGVRDPKVLLQHLVLADQGPPGLTPVLVDDVLTTGGHLLAAAELLAGTPLGRPRLAVLAGRTALNPPDDPFAMVVERLDELEKDLPGYRNYQIATGRAGVAGRNYHGFASLWLPHERRGDFTGMVNRCRNRHGYTDDIAWDSITPANVSFYVDVVQAFFADSRFMVHLIITTVMPNTHSAQRGGDPHLRRCVEMLHQMKMQFFASGAEPEAFHLRVAFPDDWPAVAEELKGLAAAVKGAAIASIVDRRWVGNPFAQIADLFLAAVIADWEGIALNDGQRALRDAVVSGLGWEAWGDLRGDTYMNSWKFNIWTYHNPRMGLARRIQSRRVKEYTPYRADWVRKRR